MRSDPLLGNEQFPHETVYCRVCGFNFEDAFKPPTGEDAYSYPYIKLLQKMWPGNWKQQLRQLNIKISTVNASNGNKNIREIHAVSEYEWWVFIGILISAGPHDRGGIKLWAKQSYGFTVTSPINYGPAGLNVMAYYRFNEIKANFPWSFQDKSKAEEEQESYDPWNMILLMIDGYNSNRRSWVAASVRKVLDESMSAWCPQTTKTGGLPHLSFILRKPEPLGTEFKDIACTVTGTLFIMLPFACHGRSAIAVIPSRSLLCNISQRQSMSKWQQLLHLVL
jgi:hypothetical protein